MVCEDFPERILLKSTSEIRECEVTFVENLYSITIGFVTKVSF